MECFCSGTAVIVCPVSNIEYKGEQYKININDEYKAGELTYEIFNEILGIQEGRLKDKFGWSKVIKETKK